MIVHHISRAQLELLFVQIAKPSQPYPGGPIVWMAPAWWYALHAASLPESLN